MLQSSHALLLVTAVIWLAACSGSDDGAPATTSQSPTTSQEPTTPPPTTQPPNTAPPSTQPPGSQPTGSTPPDSGSSGTFAQGTGFNSHVRMIVMTQDGTNDIYVGGDFTTYNGVAANHLIRLRPNGTVAQTFGQGFNEVVSALALARDGSNALYAGGPFTQFNGQPAPPMVRLTPNGVRDATFQPASFGEFIAVLEDGSRDVYVAGPGPHLSPPLGNSGTTVRLNPDGTPDPMYSPGTFVVGGDPTVGAIATIAVPPGSGKLYVGGSMMSFNGEEIGSLVRLNPDGTLDRTFPTDIIGGHPNFVIIQTIAPARNGSGDVYVGGFFFSKRLHENGAPDPSYAQAVELVRENVISSAQDGTGDVFVSGYSGNGFRLLRLNRNGALVPTFLEPSLAAETPFDPWVLTLVPVLDGTRDLYVGGAFTTYNGVPVNHIARIHADGSLASIVN